MITSINDFIKLTLNGNYSREDLATIWGYSNMNAFRRGIFTPKDTNIIVFFVTQEKSDAITQYKDEMANGYLHLEGEEKHSSDKRIIMNMDSCTDVFFLFYRNNGKDLFKFYGEVKLVDAQEYSGKPSEFRFKVMQ